MRALLMTATAALALGVLAGCGDASTPAASDQTTTTTTTSEEPKTTPAVPVPSSDVATPQPPSAGRPQNPSSGEPKVTIGQDGPVAPPGVTEVPVSQIDSSALPEYYGEYSDRAWVHEDGFTLEVIAYASSGCTGAEAVVVDQAADAVKIILRPMDQPPGGRPDDQVCTTVETPRVVVVTLDQPLQDRKILLSAGR